MRLNAEKIGITLALSVATLAVAGLFFIAANHVLLTFGAGL